MQDVVERLRPYLLGWRAYFRLAQTPKVWRKLDEGLRHRLRAMGASAGLARQVAANSRRWWRNSGKLLNSVLDLAWFDRMGRPRLS
jgi:RNA-directed DNA polymerase